jgi:hypothetical protein
MVVINNDPCSYRNQLLMFDKLPLIKRLEYLSDYLLHRMFLCIFIMALIEVIFKKITDDPDKIPGNWSSYSICVYIMVLMFTKVRVNERKRLIVNSVWKENLIKLNIVPFLHITVRFVPLYLFANLSNGGDNSINYVRSLIVYYSIISCYIFIYSIYKLKDLWSMSNTVFIIQSIRIICGFIMVNIISKLVYYQNCDKIFTSIIGYELLYILSESCDILSNITAIGLEITNKNMVLVMILKERIINPMIKLMVLFSFISISHNYDNSDMTILQSDLNAITIIMVIFTCMLLLTHDNISNLWLLLDKKRIFNDINAKIIEMNKSAHMTNPTVIYIEPKDELDVKCSICMDNSTGHDIFVPCGHVCCCGECSKQLKTDEGETCPICRTIIKEKYTVSGCSCYVKKDLTRKCVKCQNIKELSSILIPCKHICCSHCATEIKQNHEPCPKCKKSVKRIQHIYIVNS